MTSSLLMPRRRLRTPPATHATTVPGETLPTAILNWRHPRLGALLRQVTSHDPQDPLDLLRIAHGLIARTIRPVYSVEEQQPVSETLRRERGSCSQRLAVLEALARASGIPTRVRGLLVDGAFWYPRFPRLRFLVPGHVVLAWPEFRPSDVWIQASELFGSLPHLSGAPGGGFANTGKETLFDALSRTAVDWDGTTSGPETCSACDLSATVLADLGRYASRDELFTQYGQTLCWTARTLADPILSRWNAPAAPK